MININYGMKTMTKLLRFRRGDYNAPQVHITSWEISLRYLLTRSHPLIKYRNGLTSWWLVLDLGHIRSIYNRELRTASPPLAKTILPDVVKNDPNSRNRALSSVTGSVNTNEIKTLSFIIIFIAQSMPPDLRRQKHTSWSLAGKKYAE